MSSRLVRAASLVAFLLGSPVFGSGGGAVAGSELFRFTNDPAVNLHHLLIHWAAAETERRPRWAEPLVERDAGLDGWSPEDRAAWGAAVAAYARAVDRSLVFDAGLVAVRETLAGGGSREAVPAQDRILVATIERALPIYRERFWPRHEWLNRDWLEDLLPVLRETERSLASRLEMAYGAEWPPKPIRVDLVAWANDVGAYSTGGVLTIATRDPGNRMPFALEMVFHEASHVDALEGALRSQVERAFAAEKRTPPERLWHDLIFLTTGEAVRLELASRGRLGYEPYGVFGVYRRGERWPPQLAASAAHWRPFLESGSGEDEARQAALRAFARALPE